MVQSEQHVIYRLMVGGGREAQANMEETNGERLHELKITTVDPQERSTWISGVRSAMRAASQLPGRGGPLMWMMPLHLHVNQSDYDEVNVKRNPVEQLH